MGVKSYIRNGNTGLLSGTSSTGNTFFNTVWWNPSTGLVAWQSAGRQTTVTGLSGTLSGDIVGVEVFLQNTYDPSDTGNVSLNVQISLDGGDNYSDAISTGTLNNTSTQDYTLGGSTNTWGLTWPSTLDYSNLRIKGTSVGGVIYSTSAQIKFYFKNSPPPAHQQSVVSRRHEFRISKEMLAALQTEKNFVLKEISVEGTEQLWKAILDMENSGSFDGSFTDDGWYGKISGSFTGSISASFTPEAFIAVGNDSTGLFGGNGETGVNNVHGKISGSMIGFNGPITFAGKYPQSYTYNGVAYTKGNTNLGGNDSAFTGSFFCGFNGSIKTNGTWFTGSFHTGNTFVSITGSGNLASKTERPYIIRPQSYWKEARKPNKRKVTNVKEADLSVPVINDRTERTTGVKTLRMAKFEEKIKVKKGKK